MDKSKLLTSLFGPPGKFPEENKILPGFEAAYYPPEWIYPWYTEGAEPNREKT